MNLQTEKLNILIADDNEINLKLINALVKKENIRCTFANNGQEAIDLMKEHLFDGVIMDIQMPIMDGFEAVKRIKNDELHRHIPIIALTANNSSEDREGAMSAGFDDFITKPISKNELLKKIFINFKEKVR